MTTELIWSLLIKGSLFVGLAAVAALALRRTSAARRHAVWLIALVAALLAPIAEVKLPTWDVSAAQTPMIAPFVVPPALRVVKPVAAPSTLSAAEPIAATAPVREIPFAVIWWAGFLACATWVAVGFVRAGLLVRSGTEWKPESGTVNQLLNGVRILTVQGIQIPATAGVFRPVILLPEEARYWESERLLMVLSHEMGHVHRRDWLWLFVSQAACALHFFNPLIWLAAKQIRKESEFACDDYVLSRGVEPTSYAQELLEIARRSRMRTTGVCGMARNRNVENRLRSIVDAGRRRNWVSGRAMGALLIGSLIVVTPIAVLRAAAKPAIRSQDSMKPPLIEWVASREVEPNVYLAQDGVAGLPGGISVRLVGVGTTHDEIWDLNQRVLPDQEKWRSGGIYWQGNVFHRWSHGFVSDFAKLNRNFVVEVQSSKTIETGFTSRIVDMEPLTELQRLNPIYAGADDHIPDIEFKANDPSCSLINISIPKRSTTAVYRVGIADPNWTTVGEIESPYHGDANGIGKEGNAPERDACGIHLGNEPTIYYAGKDGNYHNEKLLGSQKLSADMARRIRLFDKDGQPIELPEDTPSDTNGYMLLQLPADTFARISKIVLQTSPYRWAEFRDVPLRPDFELEKAKRLDRGVRGTAKGIAPGFSHKLTNGVTVSVVAVGRAALDGKNWTFVGQPFWRADGQVLAKAPEVYDWPMEAKIWGQNPLVEFKLRYDNLPIGAEMVIHAGGQIDKSFWLYGNYDSSRSSSDTLITAYLPQATTGDLEVGVATGAWRTIARQPIDVAEQPEVHNQGRFGETGVKFKIGDEATFIDVDRRKVKMTGQSLKGISKRLVAVLKTGEVRPLTVPTSGPKGVEEYYLPARHGETTENFNHLIASQVKEVQLQVRPYEWTKFTGVAIDHK